MIKEDNISRDSFVKGAFVLGLAGVIVRLIGGFFRIPLGNILGLDAMGYYSAAYPVYTLFVVLSTAGLPTAIAKLIAEYRALGEQRNINSAFKAGLVLMSAIGLFGFLVVWFGADWIVTWINNPGAKLSLLALAPGILIVSIMAVFRGYFQGYQAMTPFALSQVVEQIGRVVVGYALAILFLKISSEAAAAGATFGATAGAAVGLALILLFYSRFVRRGAGVVAHAAGGKVFLKARNLGGDNIASSLSTMKRNVASGRALTRSEIVRKILVIAVPITLGAAILPLINIVDVAQIMNLLTRIGFSEQNANELFAMYSSYALTIINLPQALTMAIQISVVPAVAAYVAIKAKAELASLINNALRITFILALPAAAGIMLLATPIIHLMYPARADVAPTIGALLVWLGPSVIFLGLFQATTGILQGMNRPMIPAVNMLISVVCKVMLNHFLIQIPSLNIYGAAISTTIAYIVAFLLNYAMMHRNLGFRLDIKALLVKPLISVIAMSVVVWISQLVFGLFLGRIATILSVTAGVVVYLFMLFFTKTLSDEDYAMIPGGRKLQKLERKLFRRGTK
ncbi:MAG: polysaccharide biosynthesis protein [Bacillota bacterium]|nr:polysaccharide biosynthesis protein [Bacillota bacterium]